VFGMGMIHYNYRKIDEDVFGKAYETFITKKEKIPLKKPGLRLQHSEKKTQQP
jgi:hypothetical protein